MQLPCIHYSPARADGGLCAIPDKSGHTKPSLGVCAHCKERVAPPNQPKRITPAKRTAPPPKQKPPWEQRGPERWEVFHTATAKMLPAEFKGWLLKDFIPTLQEDGCQCQQKFRKWCTANPPPADSQESLMRWGVDAHNHVNSDLKKPTFTFHQICRRRGWKVSDLPEIIDPFGDVVVISLDRTPDRLRDFYIRLPGDWAFKYPRHFHAVDGEKIKAPDDWKWEKCNNAAVGCWASHLAIAREMAASGDIKPWLIMEDDCQFLGHESDRIVETIERLPDDWELLYLGGQHDEAPAKVSPGILRTRDTGRTHAFAVHPRWFEGYLAFLESTRTHIDWCLKG